ncbi:MAG: type IV pilin protein [Pseudomonadota bacterium]|nr:type IV pilin protein [Pseudomonadota bacterium]
MRLSCRDAGFTLLELIVTVMIIGILAAVAVPSYRSYVQQSALSEAQQRMLGLATESNRWRAKAMVYRGFQPESGYASADNKELFVPTGSTASNYRYKITLVDAATQRALTDDEASGRDWIMVAIPNPSSNLLKNNDQLYSHSSGLRCIVPNGISLSTTTTSPCMGINRRSWD